MQTGKHIGLFFGSFNPIHVGHLIIANHMVNTGKMDEVWLVVSPQNPHKKKASLLPDHHRLYMANLAAEDNDKLRTSDIEFKLPQPSYTIHTLVHLKEKYPNHQFSLIMGEDNLRSFHKWRSFETIRDEYHIFVYPRVLTIQEQEKGVEKNELLDHPNFELVDGPLMKISASFIRKAIKEKRDVRYLLTEPVFKYCDEMRFYV